MTKNNEMIGELAGVISDLSDDKYFSAEWLADTELFRIYEKYSEIPRLCENCTKNDDSSLCKEGVVRPDYHHTEGTFGCNSIDIKHPESMDKCECKSGSQPFGLCAYCMGRYGSIVQEVKKDPLMLGNFKECSVNEIDYAFYAEAEKEE